MKKLFLSFALLFFLVLPMSKAHHLYGDVFDSYKFAPAINYLSELKVFSGYPDGTFRPTKKLNRAEFLKILMSSGYSVASFQTTEPCFSDTPLNEWYTPYVCFAKSRGFTTGYPDGSFKPAQNVTVAEAGTFIGRILQLSLAHKEDDEWYTPAMRELSENNYLPTEIVSLTQHITRGQIAELLFRVKAQIRDKQSVSLAELTTEYCEPFFDNVPANIDMDRVRDTWLQWYNAERAKLELAPYTNNMQLAITAHMWSQKAQQRGYINHKRDGTTAYYDYNAIKNWFASFGLSFKNIYRVTFTENIGWDVYSCKKDDCTDVVLSKLKNTLNFYLSEKGKANAAHYNSMMNKYFTTIGLGIAIDEKNGKIYNTTHYATEVITDNAKVCSPVSSRA